MRKRLLTLVSNCLIDKMNEQLINYYVNQKDWWRNMDNVIINYHHKGEANMMYLAHMITPKQRIDRMVVVKGSLRWKK